LIEVEMGETKTGFITQVSSTNVECTSGFIYSVAYDPNLGNPTTPPITDDITMSGNMLTITPSSIDQVATHKVQPIVCYERYSDFCVEASQAYDIAVMDPC
jgi:hypothetical protein